MNLAAYHDAEPGQEVFDWEPEMIYNCICNFEAMGFRWSKVLTHCYCMQCFLTEVGRDQMVSSENSVAAGTRKSLEMKVMTEMQDLV